MKTASVSLKIPLLLCLAMAQFSAAQQAQPARPTPSIRINAYSIDLTLDPAHHSMTAQASVTFTALKDLEAVEFQLNPALRVSSITDATGQTLNGGRVAADDSAIRIATPSPLKQGESVSWTFTYSGAFDDNAKGNGNAVAVQLAFIGEPVSYLLYPARWFPTTQSMTDRFTAVIHVHVPAGERVFGSGEMTEPADSAPHLDKNGLRVFNFEWPRPELNGGELNGGRSHGAGFPGTIIAGKFSEPYVSNAAPNVRVYWIDSKSGTPRVDGREYAATASREYSYFTSRFGPADSGQLNVIELPDSTLPAYSAPGIAAIAGQQMQGDSSSRLLANTIAHQWWGNDVSPATLNDAWITNGMCRYAELVYLEHTSKQPVFVDAILNVSANALAYDTVPVSNASRYKLFSTEFQAMTYDKGAMIFRMLQWQIGDAAFQQTLREVLAQADKSISSSEVEKIAEAASHQNLRPFFTEWLDGTGAPTLRDNWILYRLGNNKGFRTVGEITEDLDLFQMPVEVRVETEGKTMTQRVDVAGPQTQFVIETPGMPQKISLDPDRWLLRNGPAMQVRVHILRGMNMAKKNDLAGAVREYRLALGIDNISSLASYRLGEVYFQQRNYQAAADAFRDALHGDGEPKWTEVWSDLELGKTFDASGQRDRAVNQYRETIQTHDNTGGALDLAREYLQHAYQPPAQLSR